MRFDTYAYVETAAASSFLIVRMAVFSSASESASVALSANNNPSLL